MNQQQAIIDYIRKHKTITPMQAFNDLGITKLSTRISELRTKGVKVLDVWVADVNRYGEKIRYKKYFL